MSIATIEATETTGERPQQAAESAYPQQERAQAEVARVEGLLAEWQATRATLVQQIEAKQANTAAAALGGTSPAKVAGDLAKLRDELSVIDAALAQLAVNDLAARRGVALGRLADERARLAALEAEIAERLERNRALATPLYEFELGGPADGTWLPAQSITAGRMAEAERLKWWVADEERRLGQGGRS